MAYGRRNSGSASECSPAHSFAAELSPNACSPAVVGIEGSVTPPPATDVGISNAEFKDLGDALLTSMLTAATASGSEPQQPALHRGSPLGSNESSITSLSHGSSSSFEDLFPITEKIAEMAALGDSEVAESAASPQAPASSDSEDEPAQDDKKPNKVIKLPQRKGGMQLWQFLYALLSDSQYKYLIEWTTNVKEREFRLHEPEAIAIWWGDHKNKRNMSYDKLSRSLRYYYDKGILRKINSQRYVYRFCVAPEVMYRHIGNSDCRPKLKPMSIAAQSALSTYNNTYHHGMMCHGHPISSHSMPPSVFSGPYVPPHFPSLSSNYPPPGFVPSLCQPAECGSEYANYPPMSSYSDPCTQFQPHLLSPVKHCTPPGYAMHNSSFSVHFQSCFPLQVEDPPFQSLTTDGTPSPQPISPCSFQSCHQLSPRDYSPLTSPPPPPPPPPPYSCWDSFPLQENSLL